MASILNASTTSTTGIVFTADASGSLALQGNGNTALTINSSGKLVMPNIALGTASAGMKEYDGVTQYFTPSGTQRGVLPGMQYYGVNVGVVGANATGAQSLFGVGVTLSASTNYAFETIWQLNKTAGTTSHTIAIGFGGTATLNNIYYLYNRGSNSTGSGVYSDTYAGTYQTSASAFVTTGAITTATYQTYIWMRGTVSVNAGGTFIPQYTLSAAPGGAYKIGRAHV